MQGKFLVFEGTDGSGKTTQFNLFLEFLKEKNIVYKTFDFPQYGEFWGSLVGRYLEGEFGTMDDLSPYLVTPIYTLDQASRSEEINEYLAKGIWVVSNRYATSTMAHQTARFSSTTEKDKFFSWFEEVSKKLGIIRQDLVFVLYADPIITNQLAQSDIQRKKYANGKIDIAEANFDHQKASAEEYKRLSKIIDTWVLVDCMKEGRMDTVENIQQKIRKIVIEKFKLN